MINVKVFSDLSERLHYNFTDFPLYIRKDTLHRYGYAAAYHWHPELEFIFVLDGSMGYFVNGKTVHIDTHHGIFINIKRLHYSFSAEKTDCSFVAVMLRETNRTICEIGIACGFQSASYYACVFRKVTGLLPQDYRKQVTQLSETTK